MSFNPLKPRFLIALVHFIKLCIALGQVDDAFNKSDIKEATKENISVYLAKLKHTNPSKNGTFEDIKIKCYEKNLHYADGPNVVTDVCTANHFLRNH